MRLKKLKTSQVASEVMANEMPGMDTSGSLIGQTSKIVLPWCSNRQLKASFIERTHTIFFMKIYEYY